MCTTRGIKEQGYAEPVFAEMTVVLPRPRRDQITVRERVCNYVPWKRRSSARNFPIAP